MDDSGENGVALSTQAVGVVAGMRITLASSLDDRRHGLLGREDPPAQGEGLLITPCGAIHMVGMRFPIDVVFLCRHLDGVFIVHAICRRVRPGLRTRAASALEYFVSTRRFDALETAAGSTFVDGLRRGDRLCLHRIGGSSLVLGHAPEAVAPWPAHPLPAEPSRAALARD